MAAPSLSTCSPWATMDDLCEPCLDYDGFPVGTIENMLQVASDLLFELSGRRFPGECEATVRPCAQKYYEDPFPHYPSLSYNTAALHCGCSRPSSCGCPAPSEILLGVEPIVEVTQVKVDGVILDPSLYRVDDYRYLVRLPDIDGTYQSWPCCPNVILPDTEPGTFSVTFTYGLTPPLAGVHAAAVLACELAQACSSIDGAECRLPKRVQSITRQGVSMVLLDPMEFLGGGHLGIYEVDAFLAAYGPPKGRGNSRVVNVDLINPVRRVDT